MSPHLLQVKTRLAYMPPRQVRMKARQVRMPPRHIAAHPFNSCIPPCLFSSQNGFVTANTPAL